MADKSGQDKTDGSPRCEQFDHLGLQLCSLRSLLGARSDSWRV